MLYLLLIASLLIAWPGLARGQNRVSESEYLSVLQSDPPALQALAGRIGAARADRKAAGLLQNPSLVFERESFPEGAGETVLGLSWRPPFDAGWGASKRAASAGLEAETHQYQADRLALREELRRAFADWAIADARSLAVAEQLDLVRDLARQMRARADSGEESQLSARRLAFSAVEMEAEAARAAAAAADGRATAFVLNPVLDAQATAELPPLPEIDDTLRTPDPPALLARSFAVEQAEWQLKSGSRFLEFPELAFGWKWIEGNAESVNGPVFGVSWPLPLFDRQQPDQIRASAQLVAARGQLALARARTEYEFEAARIAFERYRQAAVEAMQTTGESALIVESATTTFRLGESSLTDLLETLRSVLSARLAALELYAAALEAHRSLELATGRPLVAEEGSR